MSISQTPLDQKQSFTKRASMAWQGLIAPHPSIKTIGEIRRAQLLSTLTLLLSILLFIVVLFFRPTSIGVFLVLGGITLTSYALSRTKYYRTGTYIFAYGFTAIGFIRIYQGTASSIESSITSTVHIALIFSSALLSRRGFLSLAILSTIATFTAPLYSHIPGFDPTSIGRTGGIVFAIGAILYGIQVFRENLDKAQLRQLTESNRELEDIRTTS